MSEICLLINSTIIQFRRGKFYYIDNDHIAVLDVTCFQNIIHIVDLSYVRTGKFPRVQSETVSNH